MIETVDYMQSIRPYHHQFFRMDPTGMGAVEIIGRDKAQMAKSHADTERRMATAFIIEDNQIVRMTLHTLLRHAGYEVIGEAREGESGLESVLRLRPDVLCLDVELPGIDGIAVLQALRAKNTSLPVVIVSGHSERDTVRRLLEAGADSMVVKPFTQARLVAAIEKAILARACQQGGADANGGAAAAQAHR